MKGRWWGGAVAHYWCLAWERMRGFGWGFFWGDSFFGSTRSSSEHSDFLRVVDFLAIAFFEHSEQLGALGATRILRVGTRASPSVAGSSLVTFPSAKMESKAKENSREPARWVMESGVSGR